MNKKATQTKLAATQREELLEALKARFEKHTQRHKGLDWAKVQAKLEANAEKLWSLHEMERTGGEPDVVGHDKKTDEYLFYDCAAESPKGRRSVCYDREALDARKENKPANSAMDMAAAMGIELLTEEQYRDRALRRENIELAANPARHPKTRRRHLRRLPLRQGLRVPQRRRLVLCG